MPFPLNAFIFLHVWLGYLLFLFFVDGGESQAIPLHYDTCIFFRCNIWFAHPPPTFAYTLTYTGCVCVRVRVRVHLYHTPTPKVLHHFGLFPRWLLLSAFPVHSHMWERVRVEAAVLDSGIIWGWSGWTCGAASSPTSSHKNTHTHTHSVHANR